MELFGRHAEFEWPGECRREAEKRNLTMDKVEIRNLRHSEREQCKARE